MKEGSAGTHHQRASLVGLSNAVALSRRAYFLRDVPSDADVWTLPSGTASVSAPAVFVQRFLSLRSCIQLVALGQRQLTGFGVRVAAPACCHSIEGWGCAERAFNNPRKKLKTAAAIIGKKIEFVTALIEILKEKMTHMCTMKCPRCGNTATKSKPEEQFKCEKCGWKL